MAESLAKKFESVIKEAFEKVPGVSIDRIHDQMSGYAGSTNISDFIMYKYPYDITKNQWDGMLKKSMINGVIAGVLCWWVDKDVTKFIPIELLEALRQDGAKSIRYEYGSYVSAREVRPNVARFFRTHELKGKKKRVFFDYDAEEFFYEF